MSLDVYGDLRWLAEAPPDFKQQCAALLDDGVATGERLQRLACHRLDLNQLSRMAKIMETLRSRNADLTPLAKVRLGLLSNSTTQFLVPAIQASALRCGLDVEIVSAEYDQVLQSALDPNSELNRRRCDAVLIGIDHRGLPLNLNSVGDPQAAEAQIDAAIDQLDAVRAGIRRNSGAICLLQTIARPVESLFGNSDRAIAGTWMYLAEAYNRRLSANIKDGDVLLDVAALAETVGLANWHDPTQWNLAKIPFALAYVPLYADHVGRVLGAMRGKSRRVLVLDLDNTVWSGVIGDDGIEGINVGQGDPTGEAHLSLQSYALSLRSRGIVLAVSSKNDESVARLPFQRHPDMLLREQHIAVFQANWQDKATNLNAIAGALSLGVDSLAFIDDNPFERNLVRQLLPHTAVPELPDDPALYARLLAASGCFEALNFSAEDRKRAGYYRDNALRATLQQAAGNIEDYLASLQMEIEFRRFDALGRSRITQLINKSNQFNLTTRRYTEAEIAAVENDPDAYGMQVRLRDRFGDNGMISVIICRRSEHDWLLDTWLMSCRVLGRRVETAVLKELLDLARARQIRRLLGRFIPTERNGMVADHYMQLGFERIGQTPSGETTWSLDTAADIQEVLPMVVIRDA